MMIWLNNKIKNVATALAYSFPISPDTKQTTYNKTKDNQMNNTETIFHRSKGKRIQTKFRKLDKLAKQEKEIKEERKSIQESIKREFQLEMANTGKHIMLEESGDVAGCITKTSVESKYSIVTSDKEHFTKILSLCSHILQMDNIKPSKESFRYTFKWTK